MKSSRPWRKVLALILCIAMMSSDTAVFAAELVDDNLSVAGAQAEAAASAQDAEEADDIVMPEEQEMPEDTEETELPENTEETELPENTEEPEQPEDTEEPELPEEPETRIRFDYKSDLVNVIVTLRDEKDLPENAEIVVTPLAVTEEMQNTISEASGEENITAANLTAFDISFVADGIEVEPGATVKVQITIPEVEAGDDASVYHYDEAAATAEDMQAQTEEDGTVVFDTTHFSTYIIVNGSDAVVTVTIQHINSATGRKIYADDVRRMPTGGQINDYKKASNWSVEKVASVDADGEKTLADTDSVTVYSDTTIKVYYTATESTTEGAVTFYDYVVKPTLVGWFAEDGTYSSTWVSGYSWGELNQPEKSFNTSSNYSTGTTTVNRLTAGIKSQNYSDNQYDAFISMNGVNKNANTYTGGTAGLITGLVTGLSDDMKDVTFAVDEPGFFSLDEKTGKTILNGYTLQFKRTGDSYELYSVKDEDQSVVAYAGNSFFPLDGAESNVTDRGYGNGHNYYFGMRYDVMFTLGDYVGPLQYNFSGDDDLWVILDGKTVVIDLGGVHDALSASVDLWDALGLEEGVGATTEAEKNQEHRLTILYMERGGNASNCTMNFTIPSAEIVSVTTTTTSLTLNKVNSDDEPLAGARFKLVNDADASEMTAISQSDGTVVFRNLKVGTYTLSETMAPDGYTASTDTWKVKVIEADGVITAEVYLSNGIDMLEDNKIVNLSTEEYLVDALEYDKTAKLVDWDDRTYDINLSASSKVQYTTGGDTTITVEKPEVDVVLVLDISSSMYGNPLAQLKTAATNFVQGIRDNADAQSQIAIVTFTSSAGTVQGLTTLTDNNIDNVKNKINSISTTKSGTGTNQAAGLKLADEILKDSTNDNKYVILFTDGQPAVLGGGRKTTTSVDAIVRDAYSYASQIKDYATVYTVRLGSISGGSVSYGTYTNRTYVQWLTDLATDADYALGAANSGDLDTIFAQIRKEVTTPGETVYVPISGAAVVDVIDSRFELTDGEQERLTADGASVVVNADGTTTITWSNQTINVKAEDGTPGFSKVIHVKAKDAYIGGNAVATNVNPGSYIKVEGEKMEFDQPTVNVKVELSVGNHLEEIFLGETVPTDDEVLKNLFEAENDAFTLTWYTDKELTSEIRVSDMAEVKPDMDGAEYYLKVTYDAGAPTEDSNSNTQMEGQAMYNGTSENGYVVEAVNEEDDSLNYGIYTIEVVDGKIVITKTIPQGSYKSYQGDPIFTFKITNADTNKVYYRTVRFKNARTTTLTVSIDNLEKGHYLVEELDTIRFDMTGLTVAADATSCAYKAGDESAYFAIGYTTASEAGNGYAVTDVGTADGQIGSITFVNAKTDESNELTDTDVVKNTFAVGMTTSATKDADNNR